MHERWRSAGVALLAAPSLAASLAAQAPSGAPAPPASGGATAAPAAIVAPAAAVRTSSEITAADLRARVFGFADDSMAGRASGTDGHRKATDHLAAELARLGLVPAGTDGFFQDVPLLFRGVVPGGTVSAGGRRFTYGDDFGATVSRDGIVRLPAEAPVVFGGDFGDTATYIDSATAAGRIVVLRPHPRVLQLAPRGLAVSPGSRFAGAAAVVVAIWDALPAPQRRALSQPGIVMRTAPGTPLPPTLVASAAMAETLLGRALRRGEADAAATASLDLVFYESPATARNVVAVLPGRDPARRGQYVAIGSHSDHDPALARPVDHDSVRAMAFARQRLLTSLPAGTRASPRQLAGLHVAVDSLRSRRDARPDSIRNGADDNASGAMAVLEVAEALAAAPRRPARSVLFIWHAAEELGLLGSSWFVEHPTVPRDSIVAYLNLDMVGRGGADDIAGGGPDYVQLIGARRLSSALGDVLDRVNRKRPDPFTFDLAFDARGHRENLYCRSDQANYAKHGIPSAFLTTGLHPDYHQVTDEPQYLDYEKLARISTFVRDAVVALGERRERLPVDGERPPPGAPCRQ